MHFDPNSDKKLRLKRFSNERNTKTSVITLTNHNRHKQHNEPIRTRSKSIWLRVIGWESGASFFNQSESEVKQNQSKHDISFDTHLKTAFLPYFFQLLPEHVAGYF